MQIRTSNRTGRRPNTPDFLDINDPDFNITMAFQPIVDTAREEILGYEALLRGTSGETPAQILPRVAPEDRYHFDLMCRDRAIQLSASLGNPGLLCINFLPNAIFDPKASLLATLNTAQHYGWPADRIIFEFTEGEPIHDTAHMHRIVQTYNASGFGTAIDDFGAGYAGLNLLADFHPNIVKLDMGLIRDIDKDIRRQAIISGILQVCRQLSLNIIAEGIETKAELDFLQSEGVHLFQGFYFARPGLASLPGFEFRDAAITPPKKKPDSPIQELLQMVGISEIGIFTDKGAI